MKPVSTASRLGIVLCAWGFVHEDVDGATWAAGTNATGTVSPTHAPLARVGPD